MKVKLFAIIFAALAISPVFPQNADPQFGLVPYQAFSDSDFDHVNVFSGLLNFDIPLVNYPQRGSKLKTSFSFRYNSKYYSTVSFCDPADPSTCAVVIAHARQTSTPMPYYHIGTSNAPLVSGFSLVDDQAVRLFQTGYTLNAGGYGINNTPTDVEGYAEYQLMTSDGALHPINALYGTSDNKPLDGLGTMMTLDGTGYRVDVNGYHDKNGVTYGGTYGTEDPDGNYIGASDTMGRLIPAQTTTTDTSGCTGSLPIISVSSWSVPGPNNSMQVYKFCYATAPAYIPSSYCPNVDNDLNTTETVLQSIVLPNLQTWTFEYQARAAGDPSTIYYGDVSKITMPTGGTISYEYAMEVQAMGGQCSAGIRKRTVNDGIHTYSWTYSDANVNGYATETDPDGNVTETDFNIDGYPSSVKYYSGASTLLKQVDTTYLPPVTAITPSEQLPNGTTDSNVDHMPQTVTTTLGGMVSKKVFTYCCDYNFVNFQPGFDGRGWHYYGGGSRTASYGIQTDEQDFDYGSGAAGALLRDVNTSYLWQTNTSYLNANLINTPTSITTKDGAGNQISQTTYTYDESNYLASSGIGSTDQHAATPPVAGIYGHATTTTQWLSGGTSPATHTAWYDTGELYQEIDAKGTTSATFAYSDTYAWALPSSVTTPIGTISYTYDAVSTAETSATDLNQKLTSWTYDNVGRMIRLDAPDGGWTTYCYKDNSSECNSSAPVNSFSIAQGLAGPSSTSDEPASIQQEIDFDGLGRKIQTKLFENASSTIFTDITYDSVGRVRSVSNPYVNTTDPTYGTTSYTYDALGRKSAQTEQDGNTLLWNYTGNCTTSTDEASNSWTRCGDALGRLTSVLEPGGIPTSYGYDPLGNLLSVTQTGVSGETPRTRSFVYDSLSRLTSVSNPETGTIGYSYDANGNMITKTTPAPNSAPGSGQTMTTTFGYDVSNRLTDKYFNDGLTPNQHFRYDQTSTWAGTHYNTIGRLSEAYTDSDYRYYGSGSPPACNPQTSSVANYNPAYGNPTYCEWTDELYSYDPMGRVNRIPAAFPSEGGWNAHETDVEYDLAGNVTSLRYPDGRVVTQAWDGAGRLQSSTFDNWNGQHVGYTYASEFAYTPAGAQTDVSYGNGVSIHTPYNNRQQMCQVWSQIPSQPLIDTHIYFGGSTTYCNSTPGNNGNITQVKDWRNPNNTRYFGYDMLNRINAFSNGDGSMQQSYSYDSFGNMSQTGTLNFSSSPLPNNQIGASGYVYDAAGNLSIINNVFTSTYSFDAESKIFKTNAGGSYYTYNATGERIRKDANGGFTEYQYLNGQPIAEKSADGTWSDYIFANGQRIARIDDAEPTMHIHGNDCASCQVGWVDSSFSSPIVGYQIQQGDRLFLLQKQVNITGGFQLNTLEGGNTYPSTQDQNGDILNESSATDGAWHQRQVDLSPFAGQHVSNVKATITVSPPPNVVWDTYYRDIVILSADSSVHPIYNGQSTTSFAQSGIEGQTDLSASISAVANAVNDSFVGHYYTGDQIGSARMLTSAGGWPVSSDTFYPFGQEQSGTSDPNHYKFTGKERDTESGLDYFGARHYSSTMGRFMSPDWAAKAEPVPYAKLDNPQSLNLYAYVLNNPLSGLDLDGHNIDCSGSNAAGAGCQAIARWNTDHEVSANAWAANNFDGYGKAQQQGGGSGWTSEKPTSGDYVTVSDYSRSAGGFHHTGIAVDSDATRGFSTQDPNTPWWERIFGAPKARMEDDLQMHTSPDGEVAPHSYLYQSITSDQAAAIREAIDARSRPDSAGRYNLLFRNCAGAVESFLHAGGVSGVPHGEIFIPAVLHGILALESR